MEWPRVLTVVVVIPFIANNTFGAERTKHLRFQTLPIIIMLIATSNSSGTGYW
jgi:hypothetical protein